MWYERIRRCVILVDAEAAVKQSRKRKKQKAKENRELVN
jgi:hypothetical protein